MTDDGMYDLIDRRLDGECSEAEWAAAQQAYGDALMQAFAAEQRLRATVAALPRPEFPSELRSKILEQTAAQTWRPTTADEQAKVVPMRSGPPWWAWAASLAAAAVLAIFLTPLITEQMPEPLAPQANQVALEANDTVAAEAEPRSRIQFDLQDDAESSMELAAVADQPQDTAAKLDEAATGTAATRAARVDAGASAFAALGAARSADSVAPSESSASVSAPAAPSAPAPPATSPARDAAVATSELALAAAPDAEADEDAAMAELMRQAKDFQQRRQQDPAAEAKPTGTLAPRAVIESAMERELAAEEVRLEQAAGDDGAGPAAQALAQVNLALGFDATDAEFPVLLVSLHNTGTVAVPLRPGLLFIEGLDSNKKRIFQLDIPVPAQPTVQPGATASWSAPLDAATVPPPAVRFIRLGYGSARSPLQPWLVDQVGASDGASDDRE